VKSAILDLVRCHPIKVIQGFRHTLDTPGQLIDRRFLIRSPIRQLPIVVQFTNRLDDVQGRPAQREADSPRRHGDRLGTK
jgi:hypothetical protein